MVRVLCIYDEGAVVDTPLIGAKGFSVMVESEGRRIMMDTGLRDRYLVHNMEYLDIDPSSLEAVVVSQRMAENSRALDGLLNQRSDPIDVYAPEGLYSGKRGILSRSVGLSDDNRGKAHLHDIGEWTEIIPKVWLSPQLESDDGYRESFLAIEGRRLAVVSGRGHSGPELPLGAVRERFGRDAHTFIGAVLLEKRKKPIAEAYAADFEAYGCIDLHLNHCTGRDGMTNLRTHFGLEGVDEFYVGMELELRGSK